MPARIKETSRYAMFVSYDVNRDIDLNSRTHMALRKSMTKYGFLDAKAIYVVEAPGGKLAIKEGHHRFAIAKSLGIPVKYIVCEDFNITIQELEDTHKKWSNKDFLKSYARSGNDDYFDLLKYCEATGIGISRAAGILSIGSVQASSAMRSGRFKIDNLAHAESVADVVLFFKAQGVLFYNHSNFVTAISRVLSIPELDVAVFKRRCAANSVIFTKQPDLQAYITLLDEAYNRGTREAHRLSIAFRAKELSLAKGRRSRALQ